MRLPNLTSPKTVKWSSSNKSGHFGNRARKLLTLLKCGPNLMTGKSENRRLGDSISLHSLNMYMFDIINNRSDVVLTGKNLLLGTRKPGC